VPPGDALTPEKKAKTGGAEVEQRAKRLVASLSSKGMPSSVVVDPAGGQRAARGRKEVEAAAATLAGMVNSEKAMLERAATTLRPDGAPGVMPCREAEQSSLSKHLRAAVAKGGTAQVLYVSGMPGTGKTASVLRAVDQMKTGRAAQRFSVVHVNAMRLGAPTSVFAAIHAQLPCGRSGRCSVNAAQGELSAFFSERGAGAEPVVLLIDEIDHLVTKNQAVLYRLFDWLSLPHAGLVLVTISNTMDLPERLLPRVASRFGVVRVDFEPYKKDQIQEILRQRLRAHTAADAFHADALRLCSARVAAGSGDIRKALQICRRAVEVRLGAAGGRATGPVTLAHLQEAERDLLRTNPAVRHVAGLAPKRRRFLAAALFELWKADADAIPFSQVAARYGKILELTDGRPAAASARHDSPQQEAQYLASRLSASGVLVHQQAKAVGAQATLSSTLALGAGLDLDDLADVLRASEEHDGLKELLQERQEEHRAAVAQAA
jgi:Cdc6-like AAA superfamily ATPase